MLSLATFADELEREKAQQRTYDALAQKAKAGYVTGGRVFGYDNVSVFLNGIDDTPYRSHVERRINQTESEVVKRIFALYVQGHGYTRIAKQLNAEHVATPRSQQGRPRGWSPSSIREVLHRPLYRGQVIWNRTKKRNRWGTVQQSARPEQWRETAAGR